MSQTQIRGNKQIRSGSITNTEIASDANIALSKIAGGTELNNRVTDLESDAFVTREVPSGSVNGSNVTFTLANTPVAGSEQVYLNGLLQDPGAGNSYTISGSTITFLSAPLTNDEIHVSYATGDYMVAPGGAGGGSFNTYTISQFTHPAQIGTNQVSYTITHNLNTLTPTVIVQTNLSIGDFQATSAGWYNIPSLMLISGLAYGHTIKIVDANTILINIFNIGAGPRQVRGAVKS